MISIILLKGSYFSRIFDIHKIEKGNILFLGLKISCQDGRHQKEDAEHEGERQQQ